MPRLAHSRFLNEIVRALAEHALGPEIIDAGLAEADISAQPTQEQIAFRALQ